jgi:DNA-binding transcriptional LysR family regulator
MDLQDMRIFARVAAVQNLSSVGVELGLTPGTISKRLQALEEELSVRLFDRTTRSIRITEEGTTFLGHVERILSELSLARAAVSANVDKPKGKLRVSAPATLGRNVIAPAISRFVSQFPEVEIQIDLTDRIVNLQEEGYDVVIRTGSLHTCTLKAKRLADDPQILVAAPGYLELRGVPQSPGDLTQHDCLVLGETQMWTFRRNGEETPVRVGGRLRSDNGELLRYAALDGHGIVRLSRLRLQADLEKGLLIPVLAGYETATNSAVWALYPNTRHVLPKLRVFLDFLGLWFRHETDTASAAPAGGSARKRTVRPRRATAERG